MLLQAATHELAPKYVDINKNASVQTAEILVLGQMVRVLLVGRCPSDVTLHRLRKSSLWYLARPTFGSWCFSSSSGFATVKVTRR